MTHATFYLLDEAEAEFQLACDLASQYHQQGQRVYIHTEQKADAERIDNLLWQRDPDAFVPHNLLGEGPRAGSPVEIGWQYLRHSGHRSVLINLANNAANFAVTFAQVIDFVPCDENLKQLARERYKQYRHAGIQLQTLTATETS
ncbi:DNA polymerase III subunit chi [Thaumasiovibrio subtropicus]|uniref:DNA polymerase III subunit chi n=1 Tax=Thaumasiovibrio subtropicus TaxID=1891207 RepID=UPI000B359EAA|nr:DNA polymerase III subunit chi [Thaumasiovibrio subtropicus]